MTQAPARAELPRLHEAEPVGPRAHPWREHRLFLALTVVIGLHVVDDSFLQPQPGTSAGDHLVSGLVPLAALGLAAAAYPRLRGGGRASVALATGFFGIAGGVEALHYTREVGPSGDDFTGLLSVPAGLALLALGAATLWRTRSRHGGPVAKTLRRAAFGLGGLLIFLVVLLPLGYAYVGAHVARPPVEDVDIGAAAEDVQLHTSEGLTLEGTYVPSRNGAAVIVAFGRKGTQDPARMLARHGYGVLIFDRRGEGESDGDPNPYAWDEGERDLIAAIDFLEGRPDVEPGRIGGLGLSVGGETFLQAAANTDRVTAVVSEGASSRSVGELASVPGSPAGPIVFNVPITLGTAVFTDSMPPEHLIDQVGDIAPRSMFLIYATDGTGGEELRANRAFYREAGQPKAIWQVDSGHVGAQDAHPREYEQRVTRFFNQALGKDQR